MKTQKNTNLKKHAILIFCLLILHSVFAINNLVQLKPIKEDENIDEFEEKEGLYEEPIYDLDKNDPDNVKTEWRPIEESLNSASTPSETIADPTATAFYDASTGREEIISRSESTSNAESSVPTIIEPYAGILGESSTPESVISPDGRTRITPTTSYPWRTIVKLEIKTAIGSSLVGS